MPDQYKSVHILKPGELQQNVEKLDFKDVVAGGGFPLGELTVMIGKPNIGKSVLLDTNEESAPDFLDLNNSDTLLTEDNKDLQEPGAYSADVSFIFTSSFNGDVTDHDSEIEITNIEPLGVKIKRPPVNKNTYQARLDEIDTNYKKEFDILLNEFVTTNSEFKIGDFVGNVTGIIKVNSIGYDIISGMPVITYTGLRYKKIQGKLQRTIDQNLSTLVYSLELITGEVI